MKHCKTFFLFFLLALTWLALFWLTGSRTPWQIFSAKDEDAGTVVSLGDMAGRNYDRMGFDGGEVHYVKSDGGWLVGTADGKIIHFSKEGKEIWNHSVGTGLVRSMVISNDGKTLYAGEKSPDGYLYAMDVSDGDLLWKVKGYDLIGGEPDIRADPQCIHISLDSDGNVYAVFYRFTITDKGQRSYVSRILSLDPSGRERWRFPGDSNMDAWVNWGDVSEESGRYAFGTANYDKSKIENLEYNKNIYILNWKNGELLHAIALYKADHFNSVTMRNGPSYSKDGKYLATMTSDGRGFLFDADGNELWMRRVADVKEMNGTYFFAAGRDALPVPEGVLFDTINTFSRDNWQMPAPVIHPSGNSMYLFDFDGKFRFKYRAEGEIEGLAAAAGTAALAIGRNVRNHDYSAHGARFISLRDGSVLASYHTKGPLQAIAISDDGHSAAGIEAPAVTPEGNLLGAYRLHIWKI